jgi:hypothetical protein
LTWTAKTHPAPQKWKVLTAITKQREVLEIMRSQLIFGALTYVRNRYELCQLASKAARKLHKPTTRLQDTMNDVLIRFHHSNPLGEHTVAVEQVRKPERRAA